MKAPAKFDLDFTSSCREKLDVPAITMLPVEPRGTQEDITSRIDNSEQRIDTALADA